MTTSDYSFCQEENDTHSEGSPPPSNNDHGNTADVPFEILDPADREGCTLLRNKLDTLLDLVSKNNERREVTNMAKCMVELVQANQLLNAQVMNGREDILRIRQENDALKERLVQANQLMNAHVMSGREDNLRLRQENDASKTSAEFKRTAEKLTTQVERLELVATAKELQQLIVNLSEKHDQGREETKLSIAELKECLRVELKNDMNNSLMRLEQQEYEKFDKNKRAFEQLIVTFNEKNDEFKSSILNHAAKNHDEIKSSMAAMRKKLRLDINNAGIQDTSNQDKNETQPTYSVPSQTTNFFWKRSKTSFSFSSILHIWECDIWDCPPLIFGNKYKWSVKVISPIGNNIALGVASTIYELNFNQYLGYQKGAWSYYSNGLALHASKNIKYDLPEYKDGSKLTLILDLTGDGTLSVYHDDDASNLIEIFNNMKSGMDVNSNPLAGFVPAASGFYDNAKIEFLGFEDH